MQYRTPQKQQPHIMYKFTFTYHETVIVWAKNDLGNTREIETTNIPAACELFHESVKKMYPMYFVSNISILPIVPKTEE